MKKKEKFDLYDPRYVYEIQRPGGNQKIDREQLLQLTLNTPNAVPHMQGDFTGINHYVGTFWTHFMTPTPFAIYFQLSKMAYGDKEHAFPSVSYLAMLCGCSERTIQRNLPVLVDLGFIIILEVWDSVTGEQLPNVYMLSNTTPFISKEQYNQLPERLKYDHDKYMEKIKTKNIMRGEELPTYE
jgi:hypothetical protein